MKNTLKKVTFLLLLVPGTCLKSGYWDNLWSNFSTTPSWGNYLTPEKKGIYMVGAGVAVVAAALGTVHCGMQLCPYRIKGSVQSISDATPEQINLLKQRGLKIAENGKDGAVVVADKHNQCMQEIVSLSALTFEREEPAKEDCIINLYFKWGNGFLKRPTVVIVQSRALDKDVRTHIADEMYKSYALKKEASSSAVKTPFKDLIDQNQYFQNFMNKHKNKKVD